MLGGAAVVGSLSGIAFGTGDGDSTDGYDLWKNLEWKGIAVDDNHVSVDYLGVKKPNVAANGDAAGKSKPLLACEGLDMTVNDDQVTDANVSNVHVHKKVDKRCKKIVKKLAHGKTPKEVKMAPDSMVKPLQHADAAMYKSIHKRVEAADGGVDSVVKKEVNCGKDDGSLFIILIVLVIAFLAVLFTNF